LPWDDYAVEIQKENELMKWSVKEYAYVIRHSSLALELVVIVQDRNAVRYAKPSWNGKEYGVHAVVID
jgi:hypothetical protein